jgi:hypothetical protein
MSQSSITTRPARHKVESMNGEQIELLHINEKKFYEGAKQRYLDEYSFTMANDLRTLDRLLLLEVQMYRYQWYLMAGMDYESIDLEAKEEVEYRRAVKELTAQINETQAALGLTKAQRDKQTVDSVGGYIKQLQEAARHHGVKREKELGRAIELVKELFSLCGAFQRSNEAERRKLGFESAEDIVTWVLEYMKPEYDAIDEHFRQHQQRFYIRKL